MIMTNQANGRGPKSAGWLGVVFTGVYLIGGIGVEAQETQPLKMSQEDFVRRVLQHNEALEVRLLETEIGQRTYRAQKHNFSPVSVTDFESQDSQRPNNAQQTSSLGLFGGGRADFNERNRIMKQGLEWTMKEGGTQFRLGFSMSRLQNDINNGPATHNGEFQSNVGLSVIQPVLKNFGKNATMVNMRLAAAASDVAFQEYRKGLIELAATAEATYWDLYLAQQQHKIATDSVGLAKTVLEDNQERVKVGKASELDVLEAEAGVARRLALLNEAKQVLQDATSRAMTLFSESVANGKYVIETTDTPTGREIKGEVGDHWSVAFEKNPDLKIRAKQAEQEKVRLAYQRNQALPQLDLRGSYGLNGLDGTPAGSFEDLAENNYASWSFGFEFRVPLDGNKKGRLERDAAKLRQRQALLNLKTTETQLINALDAAIDRVRIFADNVGRYESIVSFNQRVLDTEIARMEAGKSDSRSVLEKEEDLFEARIAYIEGQVRLDRAILEMESLKGSYLEDRNIELSQGDLATNTRDIMMRRSEISDASLDGARASIFTRYRARGEFTTPVKKTSAPKATPAKKVTAKKSSGPAPEITSQEAVNQAVHELKSKVTELEQDAQ